jgi:hypothetical protein
MSKALPVTLKIAGVIAVLLLALFATLFVLDVIPRDVLKEALAKVLVILGIFTAACLVVAAILGAGKKE